MPGYVETSLAITSLRSHCWQGLEGEANRAPLGWTHRSKLIPVLVVRHFIVIVLSPNLLRLGRDYSKQDTPFLPLM